MSAAGGVVFLTAIPLSLLLIGAGTLSDQPSEVLAGLVVAALIGIPVLVAGFRARRRPPA